MEKDASQNKLTKLTIDGENEKKKTKRKKNRREARKKDKTKAKVTRIDKKDGEQKEEKGQESKNSSKKPRTPRPNFFIALPIKDALIREQFSVVQDRFKDHDPDLSQLCVPVKKTHITLQVFHAPDDKVSELEQALNGLSDAWPAVDIHLSGIGHFRRQVIFANIKDNEEILLLWKDVVERLKRLDFVTMKVEKSLDPHLTILKTSRARTTKMRKHKFDQTLIDGMTSTDFGKESIPCLQVLSMTKPQTDDGYYFQHFEVPFRGVQKRSMSTLSTALREEKEVVRQSIRQLVIHYFRRSKVGLVLKKPETWLAGGALAFAAWRYFRRSKN